MMHIAKSTDAQRKLVIVIVWLSLSIRYNKCVTGRELDYGVKISEERQVARPPWFADYQGWTGGGAGGGGGGENGGGGGGGGGGFSGGGKSFSFGHAFGFGANGYGFSFGYGTPVPPENNLGGNGDSNTGEGNDGKGFGGGVGDDSGEFGRGDRGSMPPLEAIMDEGN